MKKTLLAALLLALSMTMLSRAVQAGSVLITGSSTGIGLEFARQYAARGWTVYATHHFPKTPDTLAQLAQMFPQTVHVEVLDVTKQTDIDALATKLKDKPMDVLLNNAALKRFALLRDRDGNKGQYFGTLDFDQLDQFVHVNVAGPLRVVEGFIDNVRLGTQKKLVTISSAAGAVSIAPNAATDNWYRISKAALNSAMRLLAVQFKDEGITVVMFHPGGVKVESFADVDFPGMLPTPVAVGRLMHVIDGIRSKDSGRFLTNEGADHPW
jgi:NAD(P)-dependent dehydrogenase (short-subunit alcohol dehydrogenase family)